LLFEFFMIYCFRFFAIFSNFLVFLQLHITVKFNWNDVVKIIYLSNFLVFSKLIIFMDLKIKNENFSYLYMIHLKQFVFLIIFQIFIIGILLWFTIFLWKKFFLSFFNKKFLFFKFILKNDYTGQDLIIKIYFSLHILSFLFLCILFILEWFIFQVFF